MKRPALFLLLMCRLCPLLSAEDEMVHYDLLAPETHQFAIRYDVAATEPGSRIFYNIIRPGSEAVEEKVIDRATGKEIELGSQRRRRPKRRGRLSPTFRMKESCCILCRKAEPCGSG
jgi:hypothetical protein